MFTFGQKENSDSFLTEPLRISQIPYQPEQKGRHNRDNQTNRGPATLIYLYTIIKRGFVPTKIFWGQFWATKLSKEFK